MVARGTENRQFSIFWSKTDSMPDSLYIIGVQGTLDSNCNPRFSLLDKVVTINIVHKPENYIGIYNLLHICSR